jgi:hypothetical protein
MISRRRAVPKELLLSHYHLLLLTVGCGASVGLLLKLLGVLLVGVEEEELGRVAGAAVALPGSWQVVRLVHRVLVLLGFLSAMMMTGLINLGGLVRRISRQLLVVGPRLMEVMMRMVVLLSYRRGRL